MNSKRRYVRCRICCRNHTNPASSSLCNSCSSIEYLKNIELKREQREFKKYTQEMYINDSVQRAATEYTKDSICKNALTPDDITTAFINGVNFGAKL
jgi:hypothetical protein